MSNSQNTSLSNSNISFSIPNTPMNASVRLQSQNELAHSQNLEIARLRDYIRQLASTLHERDEKISILEHEVQKYQSSHNKSGVENMKMMRNDLEAKLVELEQRLKNQRESDAMLEAANSEIKRQIELRIGLEVELNSMKAQLQSTLSQMAEKNRRMQEHEKREIQTHREMEDLVERLNAVRAVKENLERVVYHSSGDGVSARPLSPSKSSVRLGEKNICVTCSRTHALSSRHERSRTQRMDSYVAELKDALTVSRARLAEMDVVLERAAASEAAASRGAQEILRLSSERAADQRRHADEVTTLRSNLARVEEERNAILIRYQRLRARLEGLAVMMPPPTSSVHNSSIMSFPNLHGSHSISPNMQSQGGPGILSQSQIFSPLAQSYLQSPQPQSQSRQQQPQEQSVLPPSTPWSNYGILNRPSELGSLEKEKSNIVMDIPLYQSTTTYQGYVPEGSSIHQPPPSIKSINSVGRSSSAIPTSSIVRLDPNESIDSIQRELFQQELIQDSISLNQSLLGNPESSVVNPNRTISNSFLLDLLKDEAELLNVPRIGVNPATQNSMVSQSFNITGYQNTPPFGNTDGDVNNDVSQISSTSTFNPTLK